MSLVRRTESAECLKFAGEGSAVVRIGQPARRFSRNGNGPSIDMMDTTKQRKMLLVLVP